jgi:hypothetical protein
MIIVISSMTKLDMTWEIQTQKENAHTFAQISSIEPDVNENVFDDDKAILSLSR